MRLLPRRCCLPRKRPLPISLKKRNLRLWVTAVWAAGTIKGRSAGSAFANGTNVPVCFGITTTVCRYGAHMRCAMFAKALPASLFELEKGFHSAGAPRAAAPLCCRHADRLAGLSRCTDILRTFALRRSGVCAGGQHKRKHIL